MKSFLSSEYPLTVPVETSSAGVLDVFTTLTPPLHAGTELTDADKVYVNDTPNTKRRTS